MSRLVVHKYGGSSVAGFERLEAAAQIIRKACQNGDEVVVVVSAMRTQEPGLSSLSTDKLKSFAETIAGDQLVQAALAGDRSSGREMDAVTAIGELFTAPLLALALQRQGVPAISLNAFQAGLRVEGNFSNADIVDVKTSGIRRALELGRVPVMSGFQGLNEDNELVTLGRGCSDASAVAIAAAMEADECLIYTDVAGIYTADPRMVPEAQVLPRISFDEMIEAARSGSRVLQTRSLRMAQRNRMPMRVLSSFEPELPGTRIEAC